MMQAGRNLIDEVDGFLRHKRYLILDPRGKKSCASLGVERYVVRRMDKTQVTLDRGTVYLDFVACSRAAVKPGAKPFDFGRMRPRRLEARLGLTSPRYLSNPVLR